MENTFGSRLRQRAAELNLSQGRLAAAIGSTQPAVSQMMRDDRSPNARVLRRLASVLECDLDWLVTGDPRSRKRSSKKGTLELALSWHIRRTYGDGTRTFGNSIAEIFEGDLGTAGREMGQNTLDAGLDGEVRLEFSFIELTGATLRRFLDAIRWQDLEPHYRAVAADTKHRAAQRIRAALDDLDNHQRLYLLRVDDFNARGLTGSDLGDGCFSALVRRTEDSRKQGEHASSGGRYGLGKNVFSRLSQLDLVLFCSDLIEPVDGFSRSRFIGRAFFPYHELSRQGKRVEFEGTSFFGLPSKDEGPKDDDRLRLSAWNADALLENLFMARALPEDFIGEPTGTSIMVVGYRNPQEEIGAALTDSVETLEAAIADSFWPALTSGRLSVAVSQYDNDRLVSRRMVNANDYVRELVGVLDDYNAGALLTDIDDADGGAVVRQNIRFIVPARSDGSAGPAEHEAILLVRKMSEADIRNADRPVEHMNEIAMWRAPQMVVKYLPFEVGMGAVPYQAILMAGRAAGNSDSDDAAEEFLAMSEPPAHNDWSANSPDLVRLYTRGAKTHLRDFFSRLKEAVKEIIVVKPERQITGPRDLADLLSVPSEGVELHRGGIRVLLIEDFEDNGRPGFRVTVRCPRAQKAGWQFLPDLMSEVETGGPVRVPSEIVAMKNSAISNGSVVVHDSNRDAVFGLFPFWESTNVDADFAAVFVDIAEVQRVDKVRVA